MEPGQEALEIPRAGAGEAVVHPLSSAELCPVPSSSLRTRMGRTRQQVGADLVMTWSQGCYECGVGGRGKCIKEAVLICGMCQEGIFPLQLGRGGL